MLGGDRCEDFEDVGGFFDDGIDGGGRNELGDLLAQLIELSSRAVRYSAARSVLTWGVRPDARIMSGILSRTSLPTLSLPLAIMRWCSYTAQR